MKIGILTFHRAHNYGAILQCYALQEVLKEMGHDVEVIDYRQPWIERRYSVKFHLRDFCRCILKFQTIKYLKNYLSRKKRANYFISFRKKFINVSPKALMANDIPQTYDRYIIGSDQLWNDGITHGFDKIYWGLFNKPKNSKIYGYAISGNGIFRTNVSDESIVKGVSAFDDITFRERSLQSVIKQKTGKEFPIALDPTLLSNESIWNSIIDNKWEKRNYVVVYEVRTFVEDKEMITRKAKEYAAKKNFEVVNLSEECVSISEFVSSIKHSKCIFTSSFHAIAFSIIFAKSFFAFRLDDGNDYRYVELLESLCLQNHLADKNTNIIEAPSISKENLRNKIKIIQNGSRLYLEKILSE